MPDSVPTYEGPNPDPQAQSNHRKKRMKNIHTNYN